MSKDFWRNSTIVVLGAGSWGTTLAQVAAQNVAHVRLWARREEVCREINSTRTHKRYLGDGPLSEKITAISDPQRLFAEPVHGVIWAVPSAVTRAVAKELAGFFKGHEIILHATKGVEEGTLKRVSVILREEIPCPRIGVISGPNLAREVAQGQPAATVVASEYEEVIDAGIAIFKSENFRVYGVPDVIGVEWAGALKNILAIASGCLDVLGFGWNARAMLVSRGLAEMVRFGLEMGAQTSSFLGLAGVGDLLATCSSDLSRNYRVGARLAQGKPLDEILDELGSVAEGVKTVDNVWAFARQRNIEMPITEAVYKMLHGELSAKDALNFLMTHEGVGKHEV